MEYKVNGEGMEAGMIPFFPFDHSSFFFGLAFLELLGCGHLVVG